MRGKRYKLPVVASFLEWTHSMYMIIEEIYIPELNIAFNQMGFVIETDEERYKSLRLPSGKEIPVEYLGEVEIPDRDIEVLKQYLKYRQLVEELSKKYF